MKGRDIDIGHTAPSRLYACVRCLHPSPTLYRRYSSPNAVRLTRCASCGRDVDPYVEKEALLVVIDLVLRRPEAYRHVLFNSGGSGTDPPTGIFSRERAKSNEGYGRRRDPNPSSGAALSRCAKVWVAAALLDVYLKYEAGRYESFASSSSLPPLFPPFPATLAMIISVSLLDHAALLVGTFLAFSLVLPMGGLSRVAAAGVPISLLELAGAILLPCLFRSVVALVQIWENSNTVRALGSLLILSFQYTAVRCVMERCTF